MRNKQSIEMDGVPMVVAGNPELRSFAVYDGDACVMRGKLAEEKIWVEYAQIQLTAELYAAAVQVMADPEPIEQEPIPVVVTPTDPAILGTLADPTV